MQIEQLELLISQQMEGSLSASDQAMLSAFLNNDTNKELVVEAFARLMDGGPANERYTIDRFSPLLRNILDADRSQARIKRMPGWIKYAVAALVVMALTGAFYKYLQSPSKPPLVKKEEPAKPLITPGRNGAVLTLADGTKMVLDSIQDGPVAVQGNAALNMQNGSLAYHVKDNTPTTVMYNTMTTPKGRQFQLVLPDGTKVWLNAASSLRYPTVFQGAARRVEVDGEAYFEVAKNASMPFHVQIDTQNEVEVLGTKFNVNAYDDEAAVHTTLLEGSVRIVNRQPALLQPGQQARLSKDGNITNVKRVDALQSVAWKDGIFSFNDADLPAVMRQLARWYDVRVVYAGAVPEGKFNGEIGKGLTLEQVLEGLTHTKVKYRIENNTIIILP